MTMIKAKDMREPGYYWWLPQMFDGNDIAAKRAESWSIISWHPSNDQRQKSGVFVGPLTPPIYSADATEEQPWI